MLNYKSHERMFLIGMQLPNLPGCSGGRLSRKEGD
jgi:hypothetical protein